MADRRKPKRGGSSSGWLAGVSDEERRRIFGLARMLAQEPPPMSMPAAAPPAALMRPVPSSRTPPPLPVVTGHRRSAVEILPAPRPRAVESPAKAVPAGRGPRHAAGADLVKVPSAPPRSARAAPPHRTTAPGESVGPDRDLPSPSPAAPG